MRNRNKFAMDETTKFLEEFESRSKRLKLFISDYSISDEIEYSSKGFNFDQPKLKEKPIVKEVDTRKKKKNTNTQDLF